MGIEKRKHTRGKTGAAADGEIRTANPGRELSEDELEIVTGGYMPSGNSVLRNDRKKPAQSGTQSGGSHT